MLNTPILFIVFNRPELTRTVFDSIRQVKPAKLFIASDGPREDKIGEKEKVKQVREIVNNLDWDCEVKTLFRKVNFGCGQAVSSAINWFFENVEAGIILEDDCLPTSSFYYFVNRCLITTLMIIESMRSQVRIFLKNGKGLVLNIFFRIMEEIGAGPRGNVLGKNLIMK